MLTFDHLYTCSIVSHSLICLRILSYHVLKIYIKPAYLVSELVTVNIKNWQEKPFKCFGHVRNLFIPIWEIQKLKRKF